MTNSHVSQTFILSAVVDDEHPLFVNKSIDRASPPLSPHQQTITVGSTSRHAVSGKSLYSLRAAA